jgi:hypothetical protein
VTAIPTSPRPRLRGTIIVLALLTLALFAGGMVYGYVRGETRPCGSSDPVKSRPGVLGQTEYVCPDGRTVTD